MSKSMSEVTLRIGSELPAAWTLGFIASSSERFLLSVDQSDIHDGRKLGFEAEVMLEAQDKN